MRGYVREGVSTHNECPDNECVNDLVYSAFYMMYVNELYFTHDLTVWLILYYVCLTVPVFDYHEGPVFRVAPLQKLSGSSVLSAMGLGFLLALLIFVDQNIVVSLTNAPENRYITQEFYFRGQCTKVILLL